MTKLPVREAKNEPLSPLTKAILELIQGLLPAFTAILAGLWVAYTYFENARQIAADQRAQAIRSDTARLVEAQKPFNQKQLDLYLETAQVVGRLVSVDDASALTDDWKKDARRFEALFWSELSMVEDDVVKKAMGDLQPVLQAILEKNAGINAGQRHELQSRAYRVAKALNESIASTWLVALSEVTKIKTQLCLGNGSDVTFCPKESIVIDCGVSIESWAKQHECLKYSVTRGAHVAGGMCGWSIYDVECTKRK
jgi:hypothetical protein